MKTLVGAEGIAFASEHPRRIFILALEGEHAAGVRERPGHVFQHQPLEQSRIQSTDWPPPRLLV